MTYKGQASIRSNVIDVIILEQLDIFTCLCYDISYEEEMDITSKMSICMQILGNVLKPNLVRLSWWEVYNI